MAQLSHEALEARRQHEREYRRRYWERKAKELTQ